ncbi:hypothetical protein CQ14_32950 [Bradyrhizobium lablabi]|uniref:GYF domain-containing protein n=1 Tax=Bradyrhizobium lablabi TaxID=722472 RepID=A0A0R3N8Z2_9BRAD|nr:DUF2569 family protein [Bradyrhizobium lablabi]KRR25894.1 hypothetical protein CQ14_32950 [Bradyrhizobium lablabi]
MLAVWYYNDGGEPRGPLPLAELLPLLSQIADRQHVKVWRHGFDDWKPVGEVREVARHLPVAAEGAEIKNIEPELSGIGGWLGLLAFGQVMGILRQVVAVGQYPQTISDDIWRRFPIALWGEMGMYAALIGLSIYTAWLLFNHSRRFPGFFLVQMVCAIFFPIVDLFWVATIFSVSLDQPMSKFLTVEPLEAGKMLVTAIASAIWISYVLRSRRVANTFTK